MDELNSLYNQLKKIDEMLTISKSLGGNIEIGGQLISEEQLKQIRDDLKFRITAEISQRELKIKK